MPYNPLVLRCHVNSHVSSVAESCQVMFDYKAKAEDELDMKKGDVVVILRKVWPSCVIILWHGLDHCFPWCHGFNSLINSSRCNLCTYKLVAGVTFCSSSQTGCVTFKEFMQAKFLYDINVAMARIYVVSCKRFLTDRLWYIDSKAAMSCLTVWQPSAAILHPKGHRSVWASNVTL